MKKSELKLLERAFEAEIDAAIRKTEFDFIQSKSKLADKLVEDGLLAKVEHESKLGIGSLMIKFTGYRLTELGRFTYCISTDKGQF